MEDIHYYSTSAVQVVILCRTSLTLAFFFFFGYIPRKQKSETMVLAILFKTVFSSYP